MSGTITRAKATRGDLALWDGINPTISRFSASGGTVTSLRVGDEVDVLQVYGSGTERTDESIASAILALGTRNVTLAFAPGTWTIDANVTVPSNLSCRIPSGCVFDVSAAITLTFNGNLMVEHTTWTSGSGTVAVSGVFHTVPVKYQDSNGTVLHSFGT